MFAIFLIALLLFGPKKLPELGRTLGKALSEFRRAKNELKSTFESHLQELEKETRITETSSVSTSNQSSSYSYPYEDYNPYNSESPDYSAPSQISGKEEVSPALPAPAEETSNVENPASEHEALPAFPPVSGTVARANGARSLDENVEPSHQAHAIAEREEHPV
jgi:TatA/E family protein of Tat protein translocase